MTELPANVHLTDDQISVMLDERLPPGESAALRAHLTVCTGCTDTLAQAQTVKDLLRGLPDMPLPRDFRLSDDSTTRVVVVPDPPNLVRLRRWYATARITSGALAAAFVAFLAATLYVDSGPAPIPPSPSLASRPSDAATPPSAPAVTSAGSAAAPAGAAPAQGAAAPAVSRAAPRPPSPPDGDPSDQHAATTTVGPLPTQIPTPAPQPTRIVVTAPVVVPASAASDVPWRIGAAICAILAVVGVAAALTLRRRIYQFPNSLLE